MRIEKGEDEYGWTRVGFTTLGGGEVEVTYSAYADSVVVQFAISGSTTRGSKGDIKSVLHAVTVWRSEVIPFIRELGFRKVEAFVEDKDGLHEKRARLYKRLGFTCHPDLRDDSELQFFL